MAFNKRTENLNLQRWKVLWGESCINATGSTSPVAAVTGLTGLYPAGVRSG